MQDSALLDDDLLAREVIRDPYPYLRQLRTSAPVHWNARWRGWILTDYDTIASIHKNPALSNDKYLPFARRKSPTADQAAVFEWLGLWMGSQDAPLHTRLRKSVVAIFNSRASLEAVEPVIRETAVALLADLARRPRFDLIADFAIPLTTTVIATMLGMPKQDLPRIGPWSDAISPIMFMTLGTDSATRYREAREQLDDMADYYRAVLRDRAARPLNDLMTSIAEAIDQGDLAEDEGIATCMTVVFGGHETTKDLLGNGTLLLLEHPAELARLRRDPGLWPSAIEEVLRFESPAKSTVRWAKADFEAAGQRISAGQRLLVFWAAANRDPAQFPDPDRFDVGRKPNPHLSFGQGAHYCLGASLGRREGAIALPLLFEALPDLRLAVPAEELEWHPTVIMRGLRALPVVHGS